MSNIKKGSGKYRTILHKQSTPKELHSPTNWRSKLNDTTITSKHINNFVNISNQDTSAVKVPVKSQGLN